MKKNIDINPTDLINYPWTLNHTTIWGRRITGYDPSTQVFSGVFFKSFEGVEVSPGDVFQIGIKDQYKQSRNRKEFFVVTKDFEFERITRGNAARMFI